MKYSNENGLSLIEVIMSTCLLGILIVPIFSLLTVNIKINMSAREHLIATSLAENEIEKLKSNPLLKASETTSNHKDFVVNSVIQALDTENLKEKSDMFKITVEVKKHEKIIEKIITYKNSSKEYN